MLLLLLLLLPDRASLDAVGRAGAADGGVGGRGPNSMRVSLYAGHTASMTAQVKAHRSCWVRVPTSSNTCPGTQQNKRRTHATKTKPASTGKHR